MHERTVKVLESLIREYILTGEPVSSLRLSKKYDFDVKSATIRNELNDLIQEGFLFQPYTSSGRVPTNKGYEFFVSQIMEDLLQDVRLEATRTIQSLYREFERRAFHDFIDDLSEELNLLGVGYVANSKEVYKSGLDELFGQLVSGYFVSDPHEMFQIVKDFEMLDERLGSLLNFVSRSDEPKVFIGRSPITKSRELSVIADRYEIDGDEFVLAAIGPKRMNYERNLALFRKLKSAMQN